MHKTVLVPKRLHTIEDYQKDIIVLEEIIASFYLHTANHQAMKHMTKKEVRRYLRGLKNWRKRIDHL